MTRVIGITRIRNESLIIEDTLRHVESFCDGVIVYDDCSSDDTVERVERTSTKLIQLVRGEKWVATRTAEETRHRELLYALAQQHGADWVFCFDADERYEGPVRETLEATTADGLRLRLYDAYLTPELHEPYREGPLAELPRLYGPEERLILIAWRNSPRFWFEGLDRRAPRRSASARIETANIYVKHFGKALSVEHWEETCRYYSTYFPEPYRSKWRDRIGKAMHEASDFGSPLYPWPEVLDHSVVLATPRVTHFDRLQHRSARLGRAVADRLLKRQL